MFLNHEFDGAKPHVGWVLREVTFPYIPKFPVLAEFAPELAREAESGMGDVEVELVVMGTPGNKRS